EPSYTGLIAGDTYYNLIFSGTTYNLNNALEVNNDLTVSTGTLSAADNAINIGGSFTNNAAFTTSGTVTFDAADTGKTINSGTATFNNLTFDGIGSWSLAGALDVDGDLAINTGTLAAGSNSVTIGGNFTNNAAFTTSGTVTFDGAGGTVKSGTAVFYNLTFDGIGGEWSLRDKLNVDNLLTIENGTLDLNGFGLEFITPPAVPFINRGTLKLIGTETLTNFINDITAGTVEYTGSDSYTGLAAGNSYYNLSFSGTGTHTLATNLEVKGNLTFLPPPYIYRKLITVSHTKVDENLTDFPLLFTVTDSDLKTKGFGGTINNSSGYDIIFTDIEGNRLDHEIEKYDGQTGEITAWVRVPNVSNTEDTTMYIYYSNSSVTTFQGNTAGVWNSSYAGVWHLGEADSSQLIVDSTLNGNNGIAYGGVTLDTEGKIGGADSFDGSNDYISVGNDASLNYGSSFTVQAWFKTSLAAWRWLVAKPGGSWFGISSDRRLDWSTAAGSNYTSSARVVDGVWHQGIVTYSQGNLKLYVDGAESGSWTNVPLTVASGITYIGQRGDNKEYFNGFIDEVRISNIAFSNAWISSEYNNQFSPSAFYNRGGQEFTPSAILDTASYTVSVSGDWTSYRDNLSGQGVIDFNGETAQRLSPAISNFYDLVISNQSVEGVQVNNNPLVVTHALNISSGALLDLNGLDLTATGASFDNKGILQLQGEEILTGFTNDKEEGTVRYVGDGDDIEETITIKDFGAVDYYNLVIADDNVTKDTFQAAGNLNIAGSLNVTISSLDILTNTLTIGSSLTVDGGTLAATSGNIALGGGVFMSAGALTAPGSGKFFTVAGDWENSGAAFAHSQGLVIFDGSSAQALNSGGDDFYNLTISNTYTPGVQVEGNDLVVGNNLIISPDAVLDLADNNLTVQGSAISNKGTLKLTGSQTQTNFINDTNFGTVEYTGSGSYQGLAAGYNYYNLTFSTGGEWELLDALAVNNTLTVSAGEVITQANSITLLHFTQTAGTFNSPSSTLAVGGNFTHTAGAFNANSGTVIFNGTVNQTITSTGITFYNLSLNNTGTLGSDDIVIADSLDVDGTLTITDGNLNLLVNNPNVNTQGDVTIESAGSVTKGTGVWIFDGTGTSAFTDKTAQGQDYGNLTIEGTAKTLTLSSAANTPAFTFTTLTIGADDTIDLNGENAAITTLDNLGTLKLKGSETVSIANMDTNSGLVEYYGAGDYTKLAAGNNYYSLIISGHGSFTADSDLDVNGNFVHLNGTFNAPSGTMYVGGNWLKTATGGTITYFGGYKIHTFTASGTFAGAGSSNVEVLVVAGGGGGGSDMGGGGGGGGVIYNASYAVVSSSYTVTVGTGGAGAPAGQGQVRGYNGGNSVFGLLTAIGGGGG
ncbi:MAG: DUF2341 domain-containing protein, partial [Candidatus Omnitrophica bacterium]|nr:DUF2341 domain-containing protein [Candidatus Omnitrophota bacterium]